MMIAEEYRDDDDFTIDIQAIWDILDDKNCLEDFSAGKVQEGGLPELESATSVGTDFADPAAFSPSYNSEASDSRISTSDITAEGVWNPFISDHQNHEPEAQAGFSGTLSDWTFPSSGFVAGANTLIHDFPSHGVNNLDESHHCMPNFVPPFGFAPEYRSHNASMEKLELNHADYFDLNEYTGMSGTLESVKTSAMDLGLPIPWEPPSGYNHEFILNSADVSSLTDEWNGLSSQTTAVHSNEVFATQVAKIGATTLGEKVAEESDISGLNVKCEDHIRALSNKQSPLKLDNGLKPMSQFLCHTSADIFRNKHVFPLEKERGNEMVSTSLKLSSYAGSHNNSPTVNGFPSGRSLSQTFLPLLSSNPSKNIASHVKDEKKDFPLLFKKSRQSYDGMSNFAHRKPNRVVGDHCTDVKAFELPYPQPFTSTERLYSKNGDSVAEITRPLSRDCLFPKFSSQTTHTTAIVNSFQVDDDADVCIIESLSAPVQSNPCFMNRKPLASSQCLATSDRLDHVGIGGMKFKSNDERLVLRVALQDLSQPKTEASPPDGVMAVPLLRHQRIALSWMVQKETASLHCCGGILADDQGLGKTISTIALIVKEKPPMSSICAENHKQIKREMYNLDEDDDCVSNLGGHEHTESSQESSNKFLMSRAPAMQSKGRPRAGTLVVCPTSVLRQWADELRDKINQNAKLSVLVYHGSNRTKDPCELARYDVVLTTYSIVSMEVPKQPLIDKDDETGKVFSPSGPSSKKRKYPPTSKKRSTKAKQSDNMLLESCARPLARVGWFRVVLDEAQSIKNHRTQVARACWGLRAKRRWCLSGTPIQNSVDDLYSYFRFLRYDPYATYKTFCTSIKVPITRKPATGYKKLQAILKTVMLRRTKATLLDGEPIINLPPKSVELKKVDFTTEERDFYCQLEADSRAQFEEYAAAGTVKQNYVNILLLLLRLRQACDHPLLVKGCDSSFAWRSSVEMAKKLPREKQVGLLSCLEASLAICGLCSDPPEDAVVTSCGHVFCNQCISEHLMGDDNQCPNINCKDRLSVSSVFSRAALKFCLSDEPGPSATPSSSGSEVSDKVESSSWGPSFESSKIKAALEVLKSLSDPKPSTLEVLKLPSNPEPPINDVPTLPKKSLDPFEIEEEVSDTEINEDKGANLVGGSKELVKVNGEKAIVFSQWTRMLDLLETGLKSSSIQYRRLDGTMSVLAREKAVNDFKTLPEVTVIIMSLKAASLGLNMVAACHVILLDLWWNPTTEDQAVDRAHRIGQTRPVSVLRLTVKDTVEDRILALQQKKREMVASAFGEDETGSNQARLTVEDLKYLFMA